MTTTTTAPPTTLPGVRPLLAWGTPVFQADFDGADRHNPQLRAMILEAEQTDPLGPEFTQTEDQLRRTPASKRDLIRVRRHHLIVVGGSATSPTRGWGLNLSVGSECGAPDGRAL